MIRFKVLKSPLVLALLLTLFSSLSVSAQSKYYHSDNNMPFVKMMLSMMAAMGILDRIPGPNGYGGYSPAYYGYGANRFNPGGYSFNEFGASPWERYTNNPFQRSPWLQSPWLQSSWAQSVPGGSPVWGSPDWGVIPTRTYSFGYSPYGYGYTPYGSRWSSTDLDGWVKEPWELSEWNPDVEQVHQNLNVSQQQVALVPQVTSSSVTPAVTTPIVQNFNYTVSEEILDSGKPTTLLNSNNERLNNQINGNYRQSPLAKLKPSYQQVKQTPVQHAGGSLVHQQKSTTEKNIKPVKAPASSKKYYQQEKPCITDFCGLKKPSLDGLWLTQDGEMMGIKDKRYLWSDGQSRYLQGLLKVQNEYLLASVDGHEKVMRFKYKLAGNHLLTMQPDGTIREFMRQPTNPYTGRY